MMVETDDPRFNAPGQRTYRQRWSFAVIGGSILDSTFTPIEEIEVSESTTIYVRYIDGSGFDDQITVNLETQSENGDIFDQISSVILHREGDSTKFLSEGISLEPPWYEVPSKNLANKTAATTTTAKTAAGKGGGEQGGRGGSDGQRSLF